MTDYPIVVKITTTETAEEKDSWGNPVLTENPVTKEVLCMVAPADSVEALKNGVSVVDTLWKLQTKDFWPGNHKNTVSWTDLEGIPRTGEQLGQKKYQGRGRYTNNTRIKVLETGQGDSSG